MEQNAKKLLKRISEKVNTLTAKKISQVSHAPKENEWRAYICQTKPHWEDIAWRVKEPNNRGEAEVHLGFYSAMPNDELALAIAKSEELAKGKVGHVIKNEHGIRLVWKVNLNDEVSLENLYGQVINLLSSFLEIAFDALIQSSSDPEVYNFQQTNENLWTYESKISKSEILMWLESFELPKNNFDVAKEYKAIYENFDNIFYAVDPITNTYIEKNRMDYFEETFSDCLKENGEILGEYLMNALTDQDKELLYNDFDWDRDWQGLFSSYLSETEWGKFIGGPASPDFIDGFESIDHKKLLFEIYIKSLKKYFSLNHTI